MSESYPQYITTDLPKTSCDWGYYTGKEKLDEFGLTCMVDIYCLVITSAPLPPSKHNSSTHYYFCADHLLEFRKALTAVCKHCGYGKLYVVPGKVGRLHDVSTCDYPLGPYGKCENHHPFEAKIGE